MKLHQCLVLAIITAILPKAALGQSDITLKAAAHHFQQKRYGKSADTYDKLLKKYAPSPRLYYHAAVSNLKAKRKARANQLGLYILTHFGTSQEALHIKRLIPELAPPNSKSSSSKKDPRVPEETHGLPDSFWINLPEDVRRKLKTPEGKKALMHALKRAEKEKQANIRKEQLKAIEKRNQARKSKVATKQSTASKNKKKSAWKFKAEKKMRRGERPFTAEQIAKDGANGIDQQVNPNCWFEASMAALAELPRGQRLIASMIRYGDQDSYIVRFPRDGFEYKITEAELLRRGIKDRALWASLIECAQVMKFPNNRGADGASGKKSRLAVGLGCITGCRAELLYPHTASEQEISSFIGGAVSSKNPIVAGTWGPERLSVFPPLVEAMHAYTIIGFNPASKLITIRNPHGKHSRRFHLHNDKNHRKFEQLKNGVFKMHISLFKNYFLQVCRSNI